MSKQAAVGTVARLADLGYVARTPDPTDARRQRLRLTDRGVDCLERSGAILHLLRQRWVAQVGERKVAGMERTLAAVVGAEAAGVRVDVAGWLGSDG